VCKLQVRDTLFSHAQPGRPSRAALIACGWIFSGSSIPYLGCVGISQGIGKLAGVVPARNSVVIEIVVLAAS